MDGIKFTPQDILQKQFKEKSIGKGYDVSDVDSFLDDVIKDYDTFNKEITRLQDENARLRSKVDELNRQVEVGSSIPRSASSQASFKCKPIMDILKRLSNLERRVFGSQLNSGDRDDSHLL
ncbi:DivIVA domain-containing protein [Limosilactobacillus mucosae]|uniref:cell division regulator GpsB n=1 Tax=Limosilactobacillus mucosae TaxID=97478 RepID=UPI000D7A3377|nr:cell division regulator GpsB [Limosilactobacillus mucosae]PWJ46527.1 DivIVA domain-containing protein [Limosilactobacillus mucosae]SUQ20980.1 DivIVA domain-containing protein [Limosilactobacillus mucosae]